MAIDIARDFNRFPFGRYRHQGEWSGQRFRDELLRPAFASAEPAEIEVVLDGARGLSPSFLEEAFGGLIRSGVSKHEVDRRLKIISQRDPSFVDLIKGYIEDAAA